MVYEDNRRKRITRKDIAAAAGVSVTAVTNALNDTPGTRIGEETRQRIRALAREMGYRTNFVGQALMSGRTQTVGLLRRRIESLNYNFFQHIIYGMAQAMEKDGYNLLLLFAGDNRSYLKTIEGGRVDGMLVLDSDLDGAHLDAVAETGTPTVVVNRSCDLKGNPHLGAVYSDHEDEMNRIVDEFVSLGCKRILFINGFSHGSFANFSRARAFSEAIERYADKGVFGSVTPESAEKFPEQTRSILESGVKWDGICIEAVYFAEIWVREAEKRGVKVGRDYELITSNCFHREFTLSCSERSSYNQNPELMGTESWQMLKRIIEDADGPRELAVPYERFEVRGTGIQGVNSRDLGIVSPHSWR